MWPNRSSRRKYAIRHNQSEGVNIPRILCVLLVLFVFADARVFLSTFIRSDTLVKQAYGLLWLLLCGIALLAVNRRNSRMGSIIIIHSIGSLLIYLVFGMPFSNLVQMATSYVVCVAIAGTLKSEKDILTIMKLFGVATLINLYAVYDPTNILTSQIALYSQQGSSHYYDEIGLYNAVRGAGFLVAPAGLTLLGGMALAIGLVMVSYEYKPLWLWLAFSGFACGITAGNRSFIIMLAVLILVFPIILGVRRKQVLIWLASMTIICVGVFMLSSKTTYVERMLYRFSENNMQEAVNSRIYGEASSIIILKNMSFRMLAIGDTHFSALTSSMVVKAGQFMIRPHNGIMKILGTRGIVFLVIYCYILLSSARYLWRKSSGFKNGQIDYLYRALFAALVMGGVISLFESHLESSLMLLIIGVATGSRMSIRYTRNSSRVDAVSVHGNRNRRIEMREVRHMPKSK